MENDALLNKLDDLHPVTSDRISELGETVVPSGTPYGQLAVVFLVLFCEPITAFMPMPFVAQLVTESGVTNGDPSQIGFYVGIIESSFFIAQALCILHWGRLSDRIGRRPVLLIGLTGLVACMLSFGFAKSVPAAVISRIIAGLLSGNIGVTKTLIAELSTESNRARLFSLLPITWITGAAIVPIVGGALQHPAERFAIFHGSTFLRTFPYFLPCFIAAACSAFVWVVTFFTLRETLEKSNAKKVVKNYGSVTPPTTTLNDKASTTGGGSIRAVLTRPVLIAVQNYGWLALLDISYSAILTVFLPVPISAGGLNLLPPTVGVVFGTMGLVDGLLLLVLFPPILKRFGHKKIMTAAMANFWLIFACFPWMHEIAKAHPVEPGTLDSRVWAVMGLLVVIGGVIFMGYSVNFIFINAAAPDPALLGTTNGFAQMVISLARGLGPFGATSLFSASTTYPEFLGLKGYGVFVLLGLLTGIAVYCSLLLPEDVNMKKDKERY